MRIVVTQLNEPPAIPAQVADGVVAKPGGQSLAPLLMAAINIIEFGSAGTAVQLNAGIARQEAFARCGFDQLVFPTTGTAIEGYGANVPVTVRDGTNATFTFNSRDNLWRVS